MRYKRRIIALSIVLGLIALFFGGKWAIKKIYPLNYVEYIKKYSQEYNLDPYLVAALIKTESNFQNDAQSHKSANGLMQITGDTAQWIAEKMNIEKFDTNMLYDPETNIRMGCWYLDNLREEFGDNVYIVLAAYNAGRGNVKQWLQNHEFSSDGRKLEYIPFKETDQYVKKVETNYNIYKFLYREDIQ